MAELTKDQLADIQKLFDRGAKGWALDSHDALGLLLSHIKELEARVEAADDRIEAWQGAYDVAMNETSKAESKLEAAEETIKVMKPFLEHDHDCWARTESHHECTCGLQALLKDES